ncbi:cytochrome P450 704C1-like [Henckelia pumila]|uniref:cytochrome P450 704C1-like n=1 Tax=Henckelia pumila TaxID=405737 RepID=UPI003C6DE1C6
MGSLLFVSSVAFLVISSSFATKSYLLTFLGLPFYVVLGFIVSSLVFYVGEVVSGVGRPPVAGHMLNQLIHFKRLFDCQIPLASKYHTFRLLADSHSEVYTVDPDNVKHILKTNFRNYGKGDYHCDILKDLFGDGIFAVDGDKWRYQRKLASYEFSTKMLRDFSSDVFRSNAAKLADKICEETQVELQDLLMKTTMDSMLKVGFGVDINTLSGSDETGNRFIKAFDDSNVIIYWRYVDVLWRIKRSLNIGLERNLKNNIKIIDNFVYRLIQRKRDQMKTEQGSKEDILSRFLKSEEENMSDKYLRDIIPSFITAGKDTSANTLTWFFYMISKHRLIQEKVAMEVKSAIDVDAADRLSVEEFVFKLTNSAIDRMQYLHSALTETLRLYPAVPLDGKFASEDDILPDGNKIKKGDGVAYMPYAMGRMVYIWGEDAEEFRPERWLQNGVFQAESPFKFTAFQAGPRVCLGKEFAYRQMKILAATLLFFFRFELVDGDEDATYRTMFTLHKDKGLNLHAVRR